MHILTFDEYITLKNLINSKFGVNLHLHDACAGQFFSLEAPDMQVKSFIEQYFFKQNLIAKFDKSGINFFIN